MGQSIFQSKYNTLYEITPNIIKKKIFCYLSSQPSEEINHQTISDSRNLISENEDLKKQLLQKSEEIDYLTKQLQKIQDLEQNQNLQKQLKEQCLQHVYQIIDQFKRKFFKVLDLQNSQNDNKNDLEIDSNSKIQYYDQHQNSSLRYDIENLFKEMKEATEKILKLEIDELNFDSFTLDESSQLIGKNTITKQIVDDQKQNLSNANQKNNTYQMTNSKIDDFNQIQHKELSISELIANQEREKFDTSNMKQENAQKIEKNDFSESTKEKEESSKSDLSISDEKSSDSEVSLTSLLIIEDQNKQRSSHNLSLKKITEKKKMSEDNLLFKNLLSQQKGLAGQNSQNIDEKIMNSQQNDFKYANMDFCDIKNNKNILKIINLVEKKESERNTFSDEVTKYSSTRSQEKKIIVLDADYFYVFDINCFEGNKQFLIENITKIVRCTKNSKLCSIQIQQQFQLTIEISHIEIFISYVNNHFKNVLLKNPPSILSKEISVSQQKQRHIQSLNQKQNLQYQKKLNTLIAVNQSKNSEEIQINQKMINSRCYKVQILRNSIENLQEIQDQAWMKGFVIIEKQENNSLSCQQSLRKSNQKEVMFENNYSLDNKQFLKFIDKKNSKFYVKLEQDYEFPILLENIKLEYQIYLVFNQSLSS